MNARPLVDLSEDHAGMRTTVTAIADGGKFRVRHHAGAGRLLSGTRRLEAEGGPAILRMPRADDCDPPARFHAPRSAVVVLTGREAVPLDVRALKLGARGGPEKPVAPGVLVEAVRAAVGKPGISPGVVRQTLDRKRFAHPASREDQVLDRDLVGQSRCEFVDNLSVKAHNIEILTAIDVAETVCQIVRDRVRTAIAAGHDHGSAPMSARVADIRADP